MERHEVKQILEIIAAERGFEKVSPERVETWHQGLKYANGKHAVQVVRRMLADEEKAPTLPRLRAALGVNRPAEDGPKRTRESAERLAEQLERDGLCIVHGFDPQGRKVEWVERIDRCVKVKGKYRRQIDFVYESFGAETVCRELEQILPSKSITRPSDLFDPKNRGALKAWQAKISEMCECAVEMKRTPVQESFR